MFLHVRCRFLLSVILHVFGPTLNASNMHTQPWICEGPQTAQQQQLLLLLAAKLLATPHFNSDN